MNDDRLDEVLAAWRASRRESRAPGASLARALASLPPHRSARSLRGDRWRAPAIAAGSAWLLARLAGLFLPFVVR